MKKILLLVFVSFLSMSIYSQKKKGVTAGGGFAKIDNLVAEVKKGNFQVTINEKGKEKDAMIVKEAVGAKFAPTNT